LGIPDWCEHAVEIEAYTNENRNRGGNDDGFEDAKDVVTKSSEETYEKYVSKPRDRPRDRWQALDAVGQKQSNARSHQRISGLLEDAHISPSPLPNQLARGTADRLHMIGSQTPMYERLGRATRVLKPNEIRSSTEATFKILNLWDDEHGEDSRE